MYLTVYVTQLCRPAAPNLGYLRGRMFSVSSVMLASQDNKKMKKSLEEEQRARKDLEKLVRKVLKNMNDPAWDETNL